MTGTSSNAFQYTSRENDGAGLYYYRYRYYSPAVHRFVSVDPLGFRSGDVNGYSYVGNQPFNVRDPLGLITGALGGELNLAGGLAGSLNVSGVVDGHGQVGIAVTVGGGGGGIGVSGSAQATVTNANAIQDLGGVGGQVGISAGPTVGIGPVVNGGVVGGSGYIGATGGIGTGAGIAPISGSAEGTYTWVWCLLNCKKALAAPSPDPSMPVVGTNRGHQQSQPPVLPPGMGGRKR